MFKPRALVWGLLFAAATSSLHAGTLLSEGFDSIATLAGSGWIMTNNSNPPGLTNWFQGNTAIFTSQGGAGDSYIAANFDNADFGGNISNWLISPVLALDATTVLTFYTRSDNSFPDNLEVRLSINGTNSGVGATDASVGDFTSLLLSINPGLDGVSYPNSWTQHSITLSSVIVPTTGRLAFRYVVPNTSVNGDFIGIDTVSVTAAPEPATGCLMGLGLAAAFLPRIMRRRKRA